LPAVFVASRTTSPGARLNIAKDWSSSDVFFKFNRVDNPAYYISLGVVDYGSGQHGYHWSMFSGGVDYTNFLTFRNGKVGIGDTSPSYKLDVNGTIRGYGITDSSDVRLKKNITTLDSALDKITQLRGVSYDWRTDEYPELDLSTSTQIGIIAQELELQYPELVNTDIDGYKSIQYGKLTGVLIEGINEIINILDITDAPTSTPSMYVDSNGNVGIGTTSPGAKLDVAGKVRHDEVDELNWSGDAAGNQTLSVSFTYAGYAMCEITAVASHVGIMTDYSCVRKSFIGKYSTTVFALDAYSHSTTTHGSWTYAYAEDPDRIVITKTAGTYGGGGSYWITVRAKAGENIAKYE